MLSQEGAGMYSVKREGGHVTITMADPEFQSNLTSEAGPGGQIVYRANKKDFIVVGDLGVKEVGEVPDKLLIQTLHQKGILR